MNKENNSPLDIAMKLDTAGNRYLFTHVLY